VEIMAIIDTYRNNITRKKKELARLQSSRSTETKKKPVQSKKILSSKQAISRTKSTSTINSKLREIESAEKTLVAIDKKVGEIDSKIIGKEKEIITEEGKYRREEERERKKKEQDDKKRLHESEKRMKQVSDTLDVHDKRSSDMQLEIVELKKIPEEITVLFMATNPVDSDQLRLDEEARAINEMIRKSEHRDNVKFETRWAVRPADILQDINELNPAIIHFSGHGTSTGELVLQNPDGTAKYVSKEAIVQTMMVGSDDIRLVFFNTCFSFGQAQSVIEHVESAIGMTDSVGDEAAIVFAAQFYSSIGFGLSLQKAFQQAKAALMLEGISEENIPELYLKDGVNPEELVIVKP